MARHMEHLLTAPKNSKKLEAVKLNLLNNDLLFFKQVFFVNKKKLFYILASTISLFSACMSYLAFSLNRTIKNELSL